MSRKHKITNMSAFIKSTKSDECVMVFPQAKDLRLDGIKNVQELQGSIQLRFVNKNPAETLKIYGVPQKSLKDFAQVNKYGFTNLPHESCRLSKEEFPGTKDLEKLGGSSPLTEFSYESKEITVEFNFKENRFNAGGSIQSSESPTESSSHKTKGFDAQKMEKERGEFENESRKSVMLRSRIPQQDVSLQDFELKVQLGRGTFGKVYLAELRITSKLYAIKVIRKDVLIEYDQIESTQLEKDILFAADHPFLVGMDFLFQSETRLYFVMPFVRGGELYKVF